MTTRQDGLYHRVANLAVDIFRGRVLSKDRVKLEQVAAGGGPVRARLQQGTLIANGPGADIVGTLG